MQQFFHLAEFKLSAVTKKTKKSTKFFDRFSTVITKATGRPAAFTAALAIVLLWAVSGPIFNFSDTWQLVINTGTTVITFLMVFIIQQSQNKDTMALQLKLNELIASNKGSSNRLIDIEDLTEEELQVLKKYYVQLSQLSAHENDLHASHSIDEAEKNQASKTFKKKANK